MRLQGHWEGLHNPVAQQQKWALPVQHSSQHAMPLMFMLACCQVECGRVAFQAWHWAVCGHDTRSGRRLQT